MTAATANKKAAVQAKYDDLAERIDQLYAKHDTKKALKVALDEKRAAVALRCQKQEDEIKKFGPFVRSRFSGEMDKENNRFWGVSKANASQCSAAVSQEKWAIKESTQAYDVEFDSFQSTEKKDWWNFIETTGQKFNNLVAKKHDKHKKNITDDLDKLLWAAFGTLDNLVDDFGLELINIKDDIINGAEEESASLKAQMAADLTARIADFQTYANAKIDEFRAAKDQRVATLDAERKARQATLTELADELKE